MADDKVLIDPYTGQEVKTVPRTESSIGKGDISTPCKAYVGHRDRLELIDTLLGGTQAMLEAGQKYLPKELRESSENYTQRLKRTILFNGFGRTVSYLTGQVFSKPVILKEDVPGSVRGTDKKDGFVEDIDMRGNNLDVFLSKVFAKGIGDGVTTVLVDYPPVEQGVITKEVAKKRGLRPYWVHVPTSSIIGWKTGRVDGKEVFTELRIKETTEKTDPDNPYNTKTVNLIRLLRPGEWELWEEQDPQDKGAKEKWVKIDGGSTKIKDRIPLAVFMPGERITPLTSKPPLEDLAYLNLAHWQSTSDQYNILHFTRLPILFGKKLSDPNKLDEIELGPNRLVHSDYDESELRYVEHQGASINAGHAQLIDLETKMGLFGLQLLMPSTGNITATERALSSGESDSTLRSWALEFKDFVEQILVFTAMYIEEPTGGSVDVNTDFRWMQTMDAEVLLRAAQFRILPKQLVFEELRRRGIINAEWDWSEVVEMFNGEDFLGGSLTSGLNIGKFSSVSTESQRSVAGVGGLSVKHGSGKKGV
jgi:hypothetical protein